MNRKTATVCAAAVAALAMTACSANQTSAGHQYEARGVVDAKQIDYDCKGGAESLDMDPVAYTRGRGGGSFPRGLVRRQVDGQLPQGRDEAGPAQEARGEA